MKKTNFVDFYAALAVDNDAGYCVNGVELRGDSVPQGTQFYRFIGENNLQSAISLLIKYNTTKTTGVCSVGVHPDGNDGNKILVGTPQICEAFSFDTDSAARTAFELVSDFAKYKFGVDADSHSSL